MSSAVVLLGAGASCDANLPAVGELTARLNAEISAFGADDLRRLMDYIHHIDPLSASNYERLLGLALQIWHTRGPHCDSVSGLHLVVRPCLSRLLKHWDRRGADASYLTKLAALGDPVDVFTLNFDTLVEDECRSAGVEITTGFDKSGHFRPELLDTREHGIRLHKLHGSLAWTERDGPVVENRDPEAWSKYPVITLGPLKYEGSDARDSILTPLRHRFHRALCAAETCIVIGFGFGTTDPHVSDPVAAFASTGRSLIEVNPFGPRAPDSVQCSAGYRHFPLSAKDWALKLPALPH